MYTYPTEEIERLKETLQERAFGSSIPKKYSVPMFEAYEAIVQLQKELKEKEASAMPKIMAAEEKNNYTPSDHIVDANKKADNNPPLTLEELRGMGDELVWVEDWYAEYPFKPFSWFERASDALVQCSWRDTDYYGKWWRAYRRKPEEVAQ